MSRGHRPWEPICKAAAIAFAVSTRQTETGHVRVVAESGGSRVLEPNRESPTLDEAHEQRSEELEFFFAAVIRSAL